jgi:hypothetical protein
LATIVLSQQAGSAFSEIVISKTLSKNIEEKSSELLNRQTSIVISYQQKKTTTADFTKPESCHHDGLSESMVASRACYIFTLIL